MPEAGRAEEAQRAAGPKKVPLDGHKGEADRNGVCLEMRTRGANAILNLGIMMFSAKEGRPCRNW